MLAVLYWYCVLCMSLVYNDYSIILIQLYNILMIYAPYCRTLSIFYLTPYVLLILCCYEVWGNLLFLCWYCHTIQLSTSCTLIWMIYTFVPICIRTNCFHSDACIPYYLFCGYCVWIKMEWSKISSNYFCNIRRMLVLALLIIYDISKVEDIVICTHAKNIFQIWY